MLEFYVFTLNIEKNNNKTALHHHIVKSIRQQINKTKVKINKQVDLKVITKQGHKLTFQQIVQE